MRHFLVLFGIVQILSCTAEKTPANYVNPFVGTGGHGHTFPGATLPFGMVQLSPDTRIDGSWDGCSGYHYSDSIIYGFSHTHLSGTGVSDYGDILLMPQISKASFNNEKYSAKFSHKNETASAGFYSVKLDDGISVELTATTRVGFHKYAFPKDKGSVILDLTHRDELTDGNIELLSDTSLAVKRISKAWANKQHAYAYIAFSKSFQHEFNADSTKILLHFDELNEPLLTKVGLSFVSEKGAQKNLEKELPHWNFEQVKQEAKNAWNKALRKIEAKDDDEEKLCTFYTALYHTMIHPNIATDVDGNYRGMDDKIHSAKGFDYYTVFSLWDTFRATHPLFTIIDQKRSLDFIKTFLAMYEQGERLPVWELCSNETDCMIGYHSVSVMADALAKGIDAFDVERAFEAMKKSATWNHLGLPEYEKYGFLSIDDEHESVSKTLEYAYDDWCIAEVAQYLGEKDDYQTYMHRSNAWRNLLDPETKLMRPRKNGGWISPFDPREVNNHFTEGNSWQYSFFVPQNIKGMIEAMGGETIFEQKLDELYSTDMRTTGRTQVDITGLIGQYAHGNEPSHHMAYLYNYISKPQKTKERVHQILRKFYTSKPDGLIGNEDCGQMSAWYVMSAMGLYAVTPGSPQYTLTEPYLDNFTVHLENGKTFNKASITNALKKDVFISHFDLVGEPQPKVKNIFSDNLIFVRSPIISAPSISFDDSLQVSISSPEKDSVFYQIIDENGTISEEKSNASFYVFKNSTIKAYAKRNGMGSKPVSAKFYKNPHPDWEIDILSNYNPQYNAGGDKGLIDGITGDENWRKGYWQGYQGQDFEAIVDFGKTERISNFSARFLQDTRSWILMPSKVVFYISNDGKNFVLVSSINNTVDPKDYEVQIKEFKTSLYPKECRYVKIKAYNFGALPEWHQGVSGEAFIFVDEIDFKP